MGLERAHAELVCEGQGLAVVGFGQPALRRLTPRRSVAEEAEGMRLVATFLVRTGKRQCTLGEGMRLFQAASQHLRLPQGFDTVVCVFGIFFVPDMETQVAELWRMVRPGGQLAITTWEARFWSPAYEIRLEAVRRVRPDLHTAFNPWDRITTPEAVRQLLHAGGARSVEVAAEGGYQALRTPEDFWTMALGSGLR